MSSSVLFPPNIPASTPKKSWPSNEVPAPLKKGTGTKVTHLEDHYSSHISATFEISRQLPSKILLWVTLMLQTTELSLTAKKKGPTWRRWQGFCQKAVYPDPNRCWKSKAFMEDICPQVLELTNNMSMDMMHHEPFLDTHTPLDQMISLARRQA